MRIVRQLGVFGSFLVFGPLLWIGACFAARALAQDTYDRNVPQTVRAYRVPACTVPEGGHVVTRGSEWTELTRYASIFELEPGGSPDWPDAKTFPWRWSPFSPSADLLRFREKSEYVFGGKVQICRQVEDDLHIYDLKPGSGVALAGRRFRLEVRNGKLIHATELE